jgi:hypothetical protein
MQLVDALELSKETMRTVKQNLWWAFLYNIVWFPFLLCLLFSTEQYAFSNMYKLCGLDRLSTNRVAGPEFRETKTSEVITY